MVYYFFIKTINLEQITVLDATCLVHFVSEDRGEGKCWRLKVWSNVLYSLSISHHYFSCAMRTLVDDVTLLVNLKISSNSFEL